jgi:hypothetical protein
VWRQLGLGGALSVSHPWVTARKDVGADGGYWSWAGSAGIRVNAWSYKCKRCS